MTIPDPVLSRPSWVVRFTSPKFLLAVSAVAALLANKQYAEAAGVASAFILGEAGIDTANVVQTARTVQARVNAEADKVTAAAEARAATAVAEAEKAKAQPRR